MSGTQSLREKIQSSLLKEVKGRSEEEEGKRNPYIIEKSALLLETRCFNETPLNPRKCSEVLTKVLYLLTVSGKSLSSKQKTDLFFDVTKLFQCDDRRLRRLLYLVIRLLEVKDEEVFVVTSSLTKDMNSDRESYKGNAIRVLSEIIDPSITMQIERHLKSSIVSQNGFVSSSALVCGLKTMKSHPDILKRWLPEVTECLHSRKPFVQYHSFLVLFELKRRDILGLHKLIINLMNQTSKSIHAEIILLKYSYFLLLQLASSATTISSSAGVGGCCGTTGPDMEEYGILFRNYLATHIRNRSDAVFMEATKLLCRIYCDKIFINIFQDFDMSSIMVALQINITSSKTISRYAAVKILSELALTNDDLVQTCQNDLEPLLLEPNRNIAILALTVLLKICNENNIDKLIKQTTGLMLEISDNLKINIILTIKDLCFKYPTRAHNVVIFLSSMLRDEGSLEFKTVCVDSLLNLSQNINILEEIILLQVCEFIEDCEYHSLAIKIITFLSYSIPKTEYPSKYIRFIYNRLIVENAVVRAASLDALAVISKKCPELSKDICILMSSCLCDNDDEVRDRALIYINSLEAHSVNCPELHDYLGLTKIVDPNVRKLDEILEDKLDIAVEVLANKTYEKIYNFETKRTNAIAAAAQACSKTDDESTTFEGNISISVSGCDDYPYDTDDVIDINEIPTELEYIAEKQKNYNSIINSDTSNVVINNMLSTMTITTDNTPPFGGELIDHHGGSSKNSGLNNTTNPKEIIVKNKLRNLLEGKNETIINDVGNLLRVTNSIPLTEVEAEYTVELTKYIFDSGYILIQLVLINTLQDQSLGKVDVSINASNRNYSVVCSSQIERLFFDVPETLLVLLKPTENYYHERDILIEQSGGESSGQSGGQSGGQTTTTTTDPTDPQIYIFPIYDFFTVSLQYLLYESGDDMGYDDIYKVEGFGITLADFILPKQLKSGNFVCKWDELGSDYETTAKLAFSFKTINNAVQSLLSTTNLAPCDNSEKTSHEKSTHTLFLAGTFIGSQSIVLIKAMIALTAEYGCLIKISTRSKSPLIRNAVIASFEQ